MGKFPLKNKRYLPLILVLTLFLSLFLLPVSALDVSSPIINTGFEGGSVGWVLSDCSVVDSLSYNGNKSIYGTASGNIKQNIIPAIPAYKFYYYNLSIRFHDQTVYGSEGGEYFWVKLYFTDGTNTGAMLLYELESYIVDTWIVVQGSFLELEDIYGSFSLYANDVSLYVNAIQIGYSSASDPPYMYWWLDSTGYDGDYDGEGDDDDGLIYIDDDALPPDYDGDGGVDVTTVHNLINWIVMFCVIFLPALLFAGALYENNQNSQQQINPMFGLIGGLILSVGLGVYTALVPFWILVVMVAVIALLIGGMLKH